MSGRPEINGLGRALDLDAKAELQLRSDIEHIRLIGSHMDRELETMKRLLDRAQALLNGGPPAPDGDPGTDADTPGTGAKAAR